ncbi:putative chitinase [Ophiocordyceps camponoti-saundersi (nom. inval.)]|nr:putative chitinase [Ophiocordyceps camponoti-saundersi (nom. inval.)]
MYLTGQHNVVPSDAGLLTGITHVVLAFMPSTVFNIDETPAAFPLFTSVEEARRQFRPGTKLMVGIGGWGDSEGFEIAAQSANSRRRWAQQVCAMLNRTGADGVDVDWEYPGGNRDDYKIVPNRRREWEVEAFVLLLQELRAAIGPVKTLSIAVPGMERDLMAFTASTIPRIVQLVDFVNVMTYDLMNRRDDAVAHHSGVVDSRDALKRYLQRGAPASKLNLGLGYYIKWFNTQPCDPQRPLGCATQLLEDPVTGADMGNTGAFSWHDKTPPELASSFARSQSYGRYFEDGSYGYWDAEEQRWWSFDTPSVIAHKLSGIVSPLGIGGVFAWGLVWARPFSTLPLPFERIELGPRPYYLVDTMSEGPLKSRLAACEEMEMRPSKWSIGHRGGAALQFPEHSREANLAGARMGAGVLECDVSFTKDRQLVCRHSQCDLHTTTNIVMIPELNAKCRQPFRPAGEGEAASAQCCTSDITLTEFKRLCAKMDGFNASATSAKDYMAGTMSWRTDLYATCGTVMEHTEHIALVEALGLRHTPELKAPMVDMPFEGDYTQQQYAQQMVDNYKRAGVPASRVLAQSFQLEDVMYWLEAEPEFGRNAMLLDETDDADDSVGKLSRLAQAGVRTVAPPLPYLLRVADDGQLVASEYATRARELGLGIITWSLERSGPLGEGKAVGDFYYGPLAEAIKGDGDVYRLVDALHEEVGVEGVFSDWAATSTYYANCMGV